MNMPSFSEIQGPNLVVANQRLHLEVAEANALVAEMRNQLAIEQARRRQATRALVAGDSDGALRVLTEGVGT